MSYHHFRTFFVIGLVMCAMAPAAVAQWPRHTVDNSADGADGARTADANGDGLPDIATPWEEGGLIRAYFHPGVDAVREPWPAVTVGAVPSPEDAFFVDLDRDGATDVVSSCEGNERTVYVHWASDDPAALLDESAWHTEAIPASRGLMQWMFALPLDMDRDGDTDIVVGGKGDNAALGWFECPSEPHQLADWQWRVAYPLGWLMTLEAHDADRDGDMDILYSDRRYATKDGERLRAYRPGVYVLSNDDKRPWNRFALGQWGEGELMFVAAGPAPGADARFRIAGGTKHERVIRQREYDPSTHAIAGIEWPAPADVGKPKSLVYLDMDGDGVDELILSCEEAEGVSGVVALRVGGEGPVVDISGTEGIKFDRLELIDLDGDGDDDLLTCEERDGLGVIWYENPLK